MDTNRGNEQNGRGRPSRGSSGFRLTLTVSSIPSVLLLVISRRRTSFEGSDSTAEVILSTCTQIRPHCLPLVLHPKIKFRFYVIGVCE
uniref:Uncharacterized protein n=1 Tax=Steinernema glaseri TaxID=37863 RepID=A0A1I7ZP55_9BILA